MRRHRDRRGRGGPRAGLRPRVQSTAAVRRGVPEPLTGAGYRAEISVETLETIEGSLLRRALALVLEWAALHRRELLAN
ncbi:MAG: DUF4160 domain-containing protein [Longimicrobiaceae bacterium]